MGYSFLSRTDKVGCEPFDSIAWAFEVHVKTPDDKRYNFAELFGNEDSPEKIVFYTVNTHRHTEELELIWYRDKEVFEKHYPDIAPSNAVLNADNSITLEWRPI